MGGREGRTEKETYSSCDSLTGKWEGGREGERKRLTVLVTALLGSGREGGKERERDLQSLLRPCWEVEGREGRREKETYSPCYGLAGKRRWLGTVPVEHPQFLTLSFDHTLTLT